MKQEMSLTAWPFVAACLLISGLPHVHAADYTLSEAIARAQTIDPWLEGSRLKEENLQALSVSAGSLPDPTVNIGLANMPIDSFDFGQEPMTQFKVGVSQMFPRGHTLSLQREKLDKLSQMQPWMRADRLAKTAVMVSHLWSEVYRAQKSIALIEQDRGLFEHLVDVAQSSYTTASGRTRQQDLVRAQLELTRLEDRLTGLRQMRDSQLARLAEWLGDDGSDIGISISAAQTLDLKVAQPGILDMPQGRAKHQQLATVLQVHPLVQATNQKIHAGESGVELARQSYKPQWGLNASYGLRDEDPMGNDRADFLSVGVSFDLPLFTGKRQDKQVQAAIADNEAVKTERALVLRELRSGFEAAEANYHRLQERKALFDTRLLKEMSEQAEASLTAYTHDDGDFAEVVRARISELNAHIDALNIDVDIQKTVAQLNYFLVGHPPSLSVNPETTARAVRVSVGE